MFEMPCGRRFERDDQAVLHAERCPVCKEDLDDETPQQAGDYFAWLDERDTVLLSESHDPQASGPPRMNGRTAIASGNVPDPNPAPTTEETTA